MIRSARFSVLLGSCLLSVATTGCITVRPPSFSMNSKSQEERAAYEQPVEEAPPDPVNPVQLKLAYAKWMEDVGQLVEAKRHYADINQEQPQNVEALLGLARLNLLAGEHEAAEQGLEKAVQLAPESASAQSALGEFHASRGHWAKAVDPLTKAMLAAPHEARYRYQLAVSLVHVGDVDSALPHFIRTIGDAEAHYNVGLILYQQGRAELAERHFQLAVTKKPELTQARHWLAHLQQDKPSAAPRVPPQPEPSDVIPADHRTEQTSAAASRGHVH